MNRRTPNATSKIAGNHFSAGGRGQELPHPQCDRVAHESRAAVAQGHDDPARVRAPRALGDHIQIVGAYLAGGVGLRNAIIRVAQTLDVWRAIVGTVVGHENRPFVVGHRGAQVPAWPPISSDNKIVFDVPSLIWLMLAP